MNTYPYAPVDQLDRSANKVIRTSSLVSALKSDRMALTAIAADLKTRGYAFIELNPSLINLIDDCVSLSEKFFTNDLAYKKQFSKEPVFGFFGVDHKESLRLLTGSRLSEHKLPADLDPVAKLTKVLDHVMYGLTTELSAYLFANLKSDPAVKSIPLIGSTFNKWGMVDITKYHNTNQSRLNCNPHADPGVFSLSVRSTAPGLQLKDEYGKWIDAPINKSIGILWAGHMAHKLNAAVKVCTHQVVANPKPRIAFWYEVCVLKQEHKELIKTLREHFRLLMNASGRTTPKKRPQIRC